MPLRNNPNKWLARELISACVPLQTPNGILHFLSPFMRITALDLLITFYFFQAAPPVLLFCSYHILRSSIINYCTEVRQHELYLWNIRIYCRAGLCLSQTSFMLFILMRYIKRKYIRKYQAFSEFRCPSFATWQFYNKLEHSVAFFWHRWPREVLHHIWSSSLSTAEDTFSIAWDPH